ncbi:MAG TPA: hypothetical protein VE152_00590 [Acidimicrobiales bacterium]|jgi:hypothetical protein|nr:hypothetical protein [Acidimicrobiales bacterium]
MALRDRHILPTSRREFLAQWPMVLLTLTTMVITAVTVAFSLGH